MDLYFITLFLLISGLTVVVTQDSEKPRIHYLHIQSDIKFRFATTLVTSKIDNPSNESKEVNFNVVLPDEAFISDFLMEIGGVVYPGEVSEKQKAEKKYQTAKKKGQSAGQVSQRPRQTNKFSVQVNVAAREKAIFNLTYQELLYRSQGTYEHLVYINPGQIIEDFQIDISIEESRDITNVYVPPLLSDDTLLSDDLKGRNELAIIERPSTKTAKISFNPSKEDQRKRSEKGINGLFVVEYDIERETGAGDILVVNGYFVHFFAPKDMPPIPKDILFILDVSGSMSGTKINQLRKAMLKILGDLQEGDRFNIMQFNNRITYWKPGKMVHVTTDAIQRAKEHIRDMRAGGFTNINGAMVYGVEFLKTLGSSDRRSPVILFLTDGEPSAGVTNIDNILANIKLSNTIQIPVFSLAFGKSADYTFVKKVAIQNNGFSRKIYEDSDAVLQITGFYDELSATTLQNLTFTYLEDQDEAKNVTKSKFKSFFEGSELIISGRVDDTLTLKLKIYADGANGSIQLEQPKISKLTGPSNVQEITEKIWAYTTIKQLLEKSIGETDPTVKEELKERALALSLKYKFVTPLTSMVVTKPDKDDVGDVEDEDASLLNLKKRPQGLSSRSQPQPQPKPPPPPPGSSAGGGVGSDPHFIIRVVGMEHPICFDLYEKPGTVLSLLKDKKTGITVNAGIIPSFKYKNRNHMRTYIGEIFIIFKNISIYIQPTRIVVNGIEMSWEDEVPYHMGVEMRITMPKNSNHILHIDFGNNVILMVRRVIASPHMAVDYLNLYIQKTDGLSSSADGVLGQFVKTQMALKKVRINKKQKVEGVLHIQSKNRISNVKVLLKERLDAFTGDQVYCWDAHKHMKRFLRRQKWISFFEKMQHYTLG